jgi:signal peptidase I
MSSQPTIAKRKTGGLVETVKTIVYAMVIALGIRTVAFEPFNIPSGSMIPTLLIGDYLFVAKYSYGYSRFSLPLSPPLFSGRIFYSAPQRGDVAVFKYPHDTSIDYIKRLVGLPGDKIQMIHGQLYINGTVVPRQPVEADYIVQSERPAEADELDKEYVETLPGGRKHFIIKRTDLGDLNNTGEYTVPPGFVFAMGDNRDNSADSRFMNGVGFVPIENLVGRAEFIFFSINTHDAAPWWEVWMWPSEIRWSRLFTTIN